MKVNVSTAVNKKKNSFNISTRHITTLGVNDARVTNIIECVKGDKVVVDVNQFSRLSPLVAPTYGSFKLHTYAFYVPFASIWHHFYEYLDNSSDSSFTGIKEPLNVSLYDLLDIFVTWANGTTPQTNDFMTWTASAPPASTYDFTMTRTSSGTTTLYAGMFTAKGRLLWNNLQALGYSLPTYLDISGDSSAANWQMINAPRYSLFPILALARVFYDYLFPAAYVTQGGFGILFTDSLWELYNSESETKFRDIFDYITRLFVNCYDRDFFTSLWSKPNQVASNGNSGSFVPSLSQSVTSSVSLSVGTSVSNSNLDDVFVSQSYSNMSATLSAQTLRWLESISDFCMRNNIGGSRVREYLRSHYGFVSSDENSDVSKFLKSFTSDVKISDVSNLASGEFGGVLGEQAGRGQSAGAGTLKFECNDFGYLIFITSVVPQVGYYQGQKPLTRAVGSRFDFYTPEFDGIGMEAIPRSSIFSAWRDSSDWSKVTPQSIDDVFGFAPMYAERYKKGQDYLTGDFLFNSRNKNLDSYHTFRDVLYNRNNLALDAQFLETDNQTQRIFAYTGETEGQGVGYAAYDKIFSFFRFDVTRYANMKSLYQSLPMFDRSGKDVSVQYEGGQL